MAYRWSNANDWLDEYISRLYDAKDIKQLRYLADEMATQLDGDTIQDLFEYYMDSDGYFEEEE